MFFALRPNSFVSIDPYGLYDLPHFASLLFLFGFIFHVLTSYSKLMPFSPHTLRHSCASLLLISGATVKDTQLYLGHSDPSTTLKYYTGSNDDRLKKAGDGLATALNF